MAKKTCQSLALCLLTVIFAPPVHSPEAARKFALSPRISDAEAGSSRQPTDQPPASPTLKDIALPADVTPLAMAFEVAALDELASQGSLRLAHPEGGELLVTLVDERISNGTRTMAVRSDGYPGVITQRGTSFFATLATHRGVYALEHHHGTTLLIDQRQLDQRNTQQDFQHVPAA